MPQDDQKRLYQQCSETSKMPVTTVVENGSWSRRYLPSRWFCGPHQNSRQLKKLAAVLFQVTERR
jgi:hypothetical protein